MDKSPGYRPPMRWNHWTITDCCNALLITCCTALHSMQWWRLGADALPISPSSKPCFLAHRIFTISLLQHVSKCNVNKHPKNSEIDSFETWYIKKTTQIGLWSHCRCYIGQYVYAFAILTVFVLSQAMSTQHPQTFHPASPLYFGTFHPASTRYYTHWKLSYSSRPGSAVQLHTFSCISKNICVHQNSTVPINKEY